MTEMKPCPRCGEDKKIYHTAIFSENDRKYGYKCGRCGFKIEDTNPVGAEWLWNSYKDDNALRSCPFCGRAVKIIHVEPSGYNVAHFNDEYAVAITHIGDGECFLDTCMLTYNQREESMMIELWNRRVEP